MTPRFSLEKRVRTCCLWTSLLLASLYLSGCFSTDNLQQDVMAARRHRFNLWRREAAGKGIDRLLLEGPVSLEQCVELALQNSREIELVLEDQIKANAIIQEAKAEALPTVTVGAGYTRFDRTPKAAGVKVGSKNNYELNTILTQPLWRGGAIAAGVRGAKVFAAYTDEDTRRTYQKVIFDVRKAYYDARLAYELQLASHKSVEVAQRQLADVQKDLAAGVAAAFDVLRAHVQLKNFQAAHVQAENRHHLAITVLLRIMNVSQTSEIKIVDQLEFRAIDPNLEQVVESAFLNHPELLVAEYDVRLQEQAHALAKAGYYPKLDATLTAKYARPETDRPANRNSFASDWEAGLAITYHIFEGFRTRARVRQAEVDLRKSKVKLCDAEEQILLDIRQAMLSIKDATRLVESQQANVEQAEEALRLVRIGQRQGVRREVEGLDAQNALDEARANHAEAVYAHEVARLFLEKAMGTLDRSYQGNSTSPQ